MARGSTASPAALGLRWAARGHLSHQGTILPLSRGAAMGSARAWLPYLASLLLLEDAWCTAKSWMKGLEAAPSYCVSASSEV